LLTYVGFTLSVSTAVTVVALLVLRSREGNGLRIPGYPVVPWLFLLGIVAITVFTMAQRPLETLVGFGSIAAGLIAWSFNRNAIAARKTEVTKAHTAP